MRQRRFFSRAHLLSVLALLAVTVCGCGGGPDIVDVTGTVTRGGQPVQDLTVYFMPEEGRPSWGTTDAQGKFTLHYSRAQDGVRTGKNKVYVTYDPKPSDPGVEHGALEGRFDLPPDIQAIVEKYGNKDTTPLEFDIQKSQEIALELD